MHNTMLYNAVAFSFTVYCCLQLAANANDMIAMTDDEKKRLQELLSDVDALPEIPEEGMDISVSHPLLLMRNSPVMF